MYARVGLLLVQFFCICQSKMILEEWIFEVVDVMFNYQMRELMPDFTAFASISLVELVL